MAPRFRRRGPAILASTSLALHARMCLRVNVPWAVRAEIMKHWYIYRRGLPPTQDSSHKWRFRLGFPSENGTILEKGDWYWVGGGSKIYHWYDVGNPSSCCTAFLFLWDVSWWNHFLSVPGEFATMIWCEMMWDDPWHDPCFQVTSWIPSTSSAFMRSTSPLGWILRSSRPFWRWWDGMKGLIFPSVSEISWTGGSEWQHWIESRVLKSKIKTCQYNSQHTITCREFESKQACGPPCFFSMGRAIKLMIPWYAFGGLSLLKRLFCRKGWVMNSKRLDG